MRRHKVSLVGLGAMGSRHARVIAALSDRFDFVGAYDASPGVAVPAGVPRLDGVGDAIERAEVVVIATPIESHGALVARALASGRHVLVEKPLCATSAEAYTLAASSRAGARLFVGHSERFNPVVRALARLVREDPIMTLDLERVGPSRPSEWGVLMNAGVHDFDLAAYLGRAEVTVSGAVGAGPEGSPGSEIAHVLLSTSTGLVGHVYVDRTIPVRRRTIRLATARWIYDGDLLARRLARAARGGGPRTEVPVPLEEPLAAQATALADALDGGAVRELATGTDGARSVQLAEAASSAVATALWGVRGAGEGGTVRGGRSG